MTSSRFEKAFATLQELKPEIQKLEDKHKKSASQLSFDSKLPKDERELINNYIAQKVILNSTYGNEAIIPPVKKPTIPEVTSNLRNSIIKMPSVIRNASGITIYGKRIKSIVYSLDVSLIANTDADAILCVYPFTPNTQILNAISMVAKAPIFAGIGGGLTNGERSARLASHAEENNATAVVLNGPADIETTKAVRDFVDIPVIYTVIDKTRDLQPYIDAGVNIFNVSGGKDTVELVKWVRSQFPEFPIIASGGKTNDSIQATIDAGANAITYTAFGAMEAYFHEKMEHYREPSSI